MDEMDEFLNGGAPEAVEEVEATEVEAIAPEPEAKGPARGPDGKFAPKGETADASPAPETFDPAPVIAERRRRQEAESRAAELERRIAELSNPPKPPADMFEDPDGFRGEVTSTAVSQASLNAKFDTSEMLARDKFDDFDAMKAVFLDIAKDNPTLAQQAITDPHPWRKAYQIAQNHQRMQELGATDVASLEAKLREKLEAEYAAKAPAPVAIPNSLSTAQGGLAAATDQGGATSLRDILG